MSYATRHPVTRQSTRLVTPFRGALRRRSNTRTARFEAFRPPSERALGVAGILLGLCACSGQSNSVLPGEANPPPSGAGGTTASPGTGGSSPVANAGSGSTPAPTAGSGGSGTAPAGGGGTEGVIPPTGGLSGAGGSGQPSTGCQPRTNVTLGVNMTIPVSWPATLGTTAGTGDFHLVNVYRLTANGNELTGTVSPCGSELPPLTFSGLIGGGNSLIEIPPSVWETPGFPSFNSEASITGWETGNTLEVPSVGVALVGLTMSDATAAWPQSYTGIDAVDPDADGNAGITAIPATGQGFTSPPVSIIGPRTDQVHIVSRTGVELSGVFTSCTEMEGEATLSFFDNHVVGCRTVDGDICNATQTDFVDVNRTIYTAEAGTFTARILPEGATCSDARATQ
jgi:hypothetical protein